MAEKRLVPSAFLLGAFLALGRPADPAPWAASSEIAGAAGCGACHSDMYAVWSRGRHSKMVQPATPQSVKGDFERGELRLRGMRYRIRRAGDRYFISESYLNGRDQEHRVEYTLGNRRIQHYLTTLPDGRIVVLPPSWDVERGEWFHNMEIVDPEETNEVRVQVWNSSCFGCHVSLQERRFDPATKTYATRWTDFGTSCERCHGRHAHGGSGGIVSPRHLGAERSSMVCAQCHSLRDVTASGFVAGADYYDYFMPILEYAQKVDKDPAYWSDGRPRRFSNDALGLWQSRCFAFGQASCISCHLDPHEPDIEKNPQLAPSHNGLCLGCHPAIGEDLTRHTRHQPTSTGSSCVECHMPKTIQSLKSRMRDHAIGVPVPENTIRFGIPNACNACHQDKDAKWSLRALKTWFPGASRERFVNRALAFTGGRAADPAALPRLLALASDRDEPPLVRANAVGYLRRYPEPHVSTALTSALRADHPLIRAVAALTFADVPADVPNAQTALVAALADPCRIVRLGAAFSLVSRGTSRLEGADGLRLEAAKRDYVARARLLGDDPETQLNLGKFFFLTGELEQATAAFLDTLSLQPDRAGARYLLALVRLGRQEVGEARELLRHVPSGDPYFTHARGLLKKLDAR